MERILIVEDTEMNIAILKDALKDEYKLSIAKNGKMALGIMQKVVPDIILLDIMMPIMDGYETITKLKEVEAYSEIPVIFLTAQTDLHEKTKGFELGAVDYITKPFEILEVKSRVETHLALSRSKREIQELLSKTVVGATKMLMDIMLLSNPVVFGMSSCIRKLSKQLADYLKIEEAWKIEIASMLSLIGTFNIPYQVLIDILKGKIVEREYRNMYEQYPETGGKLVKKIPRLGDVATIIEKQNEHLGMVPLDLTNVVITGAQILKITSYYEMNIMLGKNSSTIIKKMYEEKTKFHVVLLHALEQSLKNDVVENIAYVSIKQLASNMIIKEDIYNNENKLIIQKNTLVTDLIIDHLKLLYEFGVLSDQIKVQIKSGDVNET